MEQWRIDYNAALGAARAAQAAGDYNAAIDYANKAASLGNTSTTATVATNLRQEIYTQAGPGYGPGATMGTAPSSGGGGGGGGGVTGGNGGTVVAPPAAFSAKQIMDSFFASIGIEGVSDWAADLYNRGASTEEIVRSLRYGTDTSDAGKAARAAYLKAFPGMDEFLKNGVFPGGNPEVQYMQYRNTVREAAARYGVDSKLVSNEAVANYIRGNTSAAELSDRMSMAATAIATTPAETYAYLSDYYGLRNNDLLSLYLDTDQTEAELQKRYTSARIGLEAGRQQFQIGREYAENLAQRGVSIDEATRGFGQAATQAEFTVGRGDTVGQTNLFEGAFGNGMDAAAIARVAAARQNRFEGGSRFSSDKSGYSGIGSAAV